MSDEERDTASDSRARVERTAAHLDAQLDVIEARLRELSPGSFDPELTKAAAAIARSVKEMSGELRQLEKHDRRMTLTPEQRFAELLKYVRTLDVVQRAELAALLDDLEQERG